ncbi:MAG: hypothetical protein LC789_17110 [Actinobacteria bacterium]|nr:hypothetical protein [Actinomycetota bacterium]MCA1722278.1 hypothetical protein [Actinomycetota bacterium]
MAERKVALVDAAKRAGYRQQIVDLRTAADKVVADRTKPPAAHDSQAPGKKPAARPAPRATHAMGAQNEPAAAAPAKHAEQAPQRTTPVPPVPARALAAGASEHDRGARRG